MKKILQKIEQNKYFPYIILSIIGILVSMPLIYTNIINLDDGQIHLFRIISLNLSIENSSFPYLITPFFCRNFGYTMVAFYPPLVTYIPYILGIFTNTFHIGIKLFTSLSIILSGIFMYNFINEVTKNKWISFLAGIIYMLAPYHLEMIFTRFAIGEFTAYAFIPIVFQGLYNLINGNKKKHYYIAIGAIGILLSHTITTIYTALFCAIYVICNFKKFLKKDIIIKCIINVIFILLISAFFIIPLIEFETQAHYLIFYPEGMRTTPDMVQETTLKAIQFIKDIEEDGVSFILGIPTFVMLFIGIF